MPATVYPGWILSTGMVSRFEDKMKYLNVTLKILVAAACFLCFLNCEKQITSLPAILASFDFEDGLAEMWQAKNPEHWKVTEKDGSMVYELISPGEQGEIRAPSSWTILSGLEVSSFELTGRLLCKTEASNPRRDMCLFFNYQDPTHFYYVHFSASSDEVHNIIGLVNGSDRVKINSEPPGESNFRLIDLEWHRFKVTYKAETGDIKAYLDDMDQPILTACDKTITHGSVGIGSFDDTGYFDDIILRGEKTNIRNDE